MNTPLISTSDGRLINLSELSFSSDGKTTPAQVHPFAKKNRADDPDSARLAMDPNAEFARKFPGASALGKVVWTIYQDPAGRELMAFLEQRNFNFKDIGTQLHIRSFLARMGLDGVLLNAEYFPSKKEGVFGQINADVEFHFLVSATRDGKLQYPLYEGMRRHGQTSLKCANLVFKSPEAVAMTEDELAHAVKSGVMTLPVGWRFNHALGVAELPLSDVQFSRGVSLCIPESGWQEVFASGKRAIAMHQPPNDNPDNFLREFDVRGLKVSTVDPSKQLQLRADTSHGDAGHIASRFLDFAAIAPDSYADVRHVEFRRKADVNVRASSVFTRATVFRLRSDVTVAPGFEEETRQSFVEQVRSPSLDQVLRTEPAVPELFAMLNDKFGENPRGIRGILVSSSKVQVLPADEVNSLRDWAIFCAKQGRPVNESSLSRVAEYDLEVMRTHPGIRAIQSTIKDRSSHLGLHTLLCDVLPSPEQITEMALTSGSGIGTFIAQNLRQPGVGEQSHFRYGLAADAVSRYRDLVQSGNATIYWAPADREVRKLIGPTFVELQFEQFYKNLDFVMVVYLSHLNHEEHQDEFERQVGGFLEQLNSLGMNIGIACGASSGLMGRLIDLCGNSSNIQAIGISTLLRGQVPDLRPKILSVIGDGGRRFRQQLLTWSADIRLALNGGHGTTEEISGDLVDSKFGDIPVGQIGLVDIARLGNWGWYKVHNETLTQIPPNAEPLSPPWTNNLLVQEPDMSSYFENQLKPYISNPLEWMNRNGVPLKVQESGLKNHLKHTAYFGRNPSTIFDSALRRFGLR